MGRHIGAMPFLVLDVDDLPSPFSQRHVLESNMIALLSNARKPPIDRASASGPGNFVDRVEIRQSDLWNVNYVLDEYHAPAVDLLETRVEQFTPFRA